MRLIPFLVCLLWAGASYGQWDTNLWPSWKTQFDGRKRALQVYSGLVERCLASGVSTNDISEPFFFTQRTRLISYKTKMKSVFPLYLNITLTNQSGEVSSNMFEWSGEGFNPTGIVYTASSVCDIAGIPTNYFDYTPWFNLNGLGANGDIADNFGGIGHAFGTTNSQTASGGTNFPSGRTNVWFTTDYGFQGIKDVIDLCVWISDENVTKGTNISDALTVNYASSTNNECELAFNKFTNQWVVGPLEFNWDTTNASGSIGSFYEVYAHGYTNYGGVPLQPNANYSSRRLVGNSDPKTGIHDGFSHDASIWGWPSTGGLFSAYSNEAYDVDGLGITNGVFMQIYDLGTAQTNARYTPYYDAQALVNYPASSGSSCPLNRMDWTCVYTNGLARAIKIGTIECSWVLKWDVANGFKYVAP